MYSVYCTKVKNLPKSSRSFTVYSENDNPFPHRELELVVRVHHDRGFSTFRPCYIFHASGIKYTHVPLGVHVLTFFKKYISEFFPEYKEALNDVRRC
ncbi:hypothetical protein [Dipodfec virus UA23Rod_1392]|uniref:Uncharacterized protein n=1 Tax=Dipodfec virus UA23Rod_1392 TaxID=2929332 RepID=A0A976N1R1_9VIRU|nr:hypothetical protein [Dipodfec virus UA23Rod_1392]